MLKPKDSKFFNTSGWPHLALTTGWTHGLLSLTSSLYREGPPLSEEWTSPAHHKQEGRLLAQECVGPSALRGGGDLRGGPGISFYAADEEAKAQRGGAA